MTAETTAMSIFDKLASRFRTSPSVQMGIIVGGGYKFLVSPRMDVKGFTVKLVTVPRSLVERERAAVEEFYRVQEALAGLPTSLRPRRKPVRPPVSEGEPK